MPLLVFVYQISHQNSSTLILNKITAFIYKKKPVISPSDRIKGHHCRSDPVPVQMAHTTDVDALKSNDAFQDCGSGSIILGQTGSGSTK
jgi:hypothetical protein